MMNPFRFRPNLTSNLSLVLASFFIAFAIWTIAKEGELTEQEIAAEVRLNVPPYAELSVSPKYVDVTIRFPVSQTSLLDRRRIWVDLGKQPGGDPRIWAGLDQEESKAVEIEPRNVILENFPRTFQVIEVQPTSVMIGGSLFNREARIEPQLSGRPSEGFVASKPQTEPPTVTLIGAPDALKKIPLNNNGEAIVQTAPINIDGLNDYFETRTEIILPEGIELAQDQSRRVRVVVPIKEEVGSRVISAIPILIQTYTRDISPLATPSTASVRVEGPLSLINALRPDELVVLPREPIEEIPNSEVTVTLDVQFVEGINQQTREKVTILEESLNPKMCLVRMESADTGSTTLPAN